MAEALQVVKPKLKEEGKGYVLELDEMALKDILLKEKVAGMKVCVVSIAGVFRQGKSFLMNFVVRYLANRAASGTPSEDWLGGTEGGQGLTGFSWKGGSERDTIGILLWSEPFILRNKDGEQVAVILMDTQGTFDDKSTGKISATIFALSTLLSSVAVYNINRQIDETHFQYLRLFTSYGKLVKEDVISGKPFQALMFLIRDWQFPYEHKYGLEGGKHYLEKMLKCKTDHGISELNEVRRYIKESFEKVECCLMPHPGLVVAEQDFKGELGDIDMKFKEQLKELVPHLFENLVIKCVNGEPITCAELFRYFKSYTAMFEKGGLPEMNAMVELMSEANNLNAKEKSKDHYMREMEKICGGGTSYVETRRLAERHEHIKSKAIEIFSSTKKMGGPKFSAKYLNSLEEEIENAYCNFGRANNAKNLFKSMRTPAVLVVLLVVNYCLQEFFQAVGLDSASGLFSALFVLAFLILATWTYNRFSGKFRDLGKKIDEGVEWAWDLIYNNPNVP